MAVAVEAQAEEAAAAAAAAMVEAAEKAETVPAAEVEALEETMVGSGELASGVGEEVEEARAEERVEEAAGVEAM